MGSSEIASWQFVLNRSTEFQKCLIKLLIGLDFLNKEFSELWSKFLANLLLQQKLVRRTTA